MNVMAWIAALAGVAIMVVIMEWGRTCPRSWQRWLAWPGGLVGAIGATGMVPVLFGDLSALTRAAALDHLTWLAVITLIAWLWWRRSAHA